MASALAPAIDPDDVFSFDINPGTLLQFLETRAEGGPRLKCFEGSVTLVSPGMPHEEQGYRLNLLLVAVCFELGIKLKGLASKTWTLPRGLGDTGYEADAAYYLRRPGPVKKHQPPDLAIEIIVSHPAKKALRAGAFLKIPELWVYDIPQRKVTFHRLATKGKAKGTYQTTSRSRAFPVLTSADASERMNDPEFEGCSFFQNCEDWARRVLIPRFRLDDQQA